MNTLVNTSIRCAGVALLMLFVVIHPAFAQNDRAADEAAMRENVKGMESGWNTKSGALFAKAFTDDADYVVINGNHVKGRAEIEKSHQHIFTTIFKDTTVTFNVKQVRFLRSDVAVVHVNGHRDSPTKELVQDAIITMVMIKENQLWKIVAFQNTAVVSR